MYSQFWLVVVDKHLGRIYFVYSWVKPTLIERTGEDIISNVQATVVMKQSIL